MVKFRTVRSRRAQIMTCRRASGIKWRGSVIMKKVFALLVSLFLMLTVFAPALADTQYLVFSTGGTTGVYYVFGGELATLWRVWT